ncbi:MAG: LysR family transcriptional regulator [Hydrogenophaga sp.]|nr:LysR family transcriptional regulator [Hydrogenophaga sp.]
MRLDRFDLNLLIALDVLLDERSVTRASHRLHIGQSATSSALARLREHFSAMGHVIARFEDERAPAFEEWFLPRHGRQRRLEACVDNFSTLPFLVMGTTRIATLHRRLAEHFARHFPVRVLAAPFDMPPVVEAMVWPRYLDNDQAHRWLRQTLLACAAELPALQQPPSPTPQARRQAKA